MILKRVFFWPALFLLIVGFSVYYFGISDKKNIKEPIRYVKRDEIINESKLPIYSFRLIRTLPHDTQSFTQGLILDGSYLYESTGRYNYSRLIKSDLETGKVIETKPLANQYFGEGLTILGNKLYQITYQAKIGFIYNKDDLATVKQFYFGKNGWGLTTDGKNLILSDGSDKLFFLDPNNFRLKRELSIRDDIGKVRYLNELEFIHGKIFANIWQTDLIAVIDPNNGKVEKWVDLNGLNPDPQINKFPNVLNGVAYNAKNNTLIVTGKRWPKLYEIELVRKSM